MTPIEERTIALAGLFQACQQVQALARTGSWDESASQASIKSVLILDAVNTPAIFSGINGIRSGLTLLAKHAFDVRDADGLELLRYATTLLHLQKQLYRDQQQFARFGQKIEQLSSFAADQQIEACSDIYREFVSNLRPQIIVQGEQDFLQRSDIPPRIRSLLLAGIRAAVLWQQVGGNRFRLIWEKRRYQSTASTLL